MSNILIEILAEFTGKKAFKQADTAAATLAKSAKKLGAALGIAFSARAVVQYTKAASIAAAQDQKAQQLLAINLKNLGLAYANLDSEKFIASLESQSAILDDELRPAYAQLARVTGSIVTTQKLMTVAFDASNGSGLSYASTIDILSQAFIGNQKGLKQLNLGYTAAELKAKSFDEIIAIIPGNYVMVRWEINNSTIQAYGKTKIIDEIKSSFPKKQKETATLEDIEHIIQAYLDALPYIQKEFSLSQMSFDLKIPERFLSNYFNKELEITFSDWRKNLRIDHVCTLIEDGEAKNLTIEAIATNAGFASRSKFIDAFKERKGVTPSAFIKSVRTVEA